MASKRTLYKPANQDISSHILKRKALPQGRLIAKTTTADTARETYASNSDITDVRKKGSSSYSVVPRLALSSRIASTAVSSEVLTENNVTPRKQLPNVSSEESPRPAKRTNSLDLSDTETEDQCTIKGAMQDVVVVDASRQLKTLDDTEVDIAVHMSQSQAKVVCHTPSKIQSSFLRSSGSVAEAAKVSVDKIPSICIAESQVEVDRHSEPMPLIKQPLVVRESGLPAAAVPHFRALMAMTDTKSTSYDSDRASSISSPVDDLEPSMAHPQSKNEKVVVNRGPLKAKCITIDEDISIKIQSKKKAPKVVASRYMQVARGPVKADRSVLPESYSSRLNTTCAVVSEVSRGRPGGGMKRSNSDTKMKLGSLNSTPDARSSYGGQSSTPNVTGASDDGSLFLPATADISAIGPLPTLDITAMEGSSRQKPRSSSRDRAPGRSFAGTGGDCVLRNLKSRAGAEVTQWDLELLYGRTLQWAFLESKVRKCLVDQEKQAMAQLHDLYEVAERQRRQKAELELQLVRLRHVNALDETLDLQNAGLNAPVSRLAQLRGQYHHLAEALDITRHHMPTKGLYFPRDRKEEFLDELSRALQESEQLLGEISVMTRKEAPCVDQCTKLLGATEMTVERQVTELSRLQNLLTQFSSLLTQENTLRVQQIYSVQSMA